MADGVNRGDFVEVRIRPLVDAGELLGILPDDEVLGAFEADGYVALYWPGACWHLGRLDDIRAALRRMEPSLPEPSAEIHVVPNRDWNEDWLRSIRPVRIGKRFVVRQSWNQADVPEGGLELVVDPRQAFGSGCHATTQLAMEFLEDLVRGGEKVLDVGTGSGILAMAALRLGAGAARGIDHDPLAIECASENARLNGFGGELSLENAALGSPDAHTYDLITANLDSRSLIAEAEGLVKLLRPDGSLVVSGILAEESAEVAGAFADAGAYVRQSLKRDDWAAHLICTCRDEK